MAGTVTWEMYWGRDLCSCCVSSPSRRTRLFKSISKTRHFPLRSEQLPSSGVPVPKVQLYQLYRVRLAVGLPSRVLAAPVLGVPRLSGCCHGAVRPFRGSDTLSNLLVCDLKLPSHHLYFEKDSPGSRCPPWGHLLFLFCGIRYFLLSW